MKPHKHAEVLRAIADGVPFSEFELHSPEWTVDSWLSLDMYTSLVLCEEYEIRRKPQYIMVNGFKVPKPLDLMADNKLVYVPEVGQEEFYDAVRADSVWASRAKERGIAHATKEAAIAHAKAMLGIDPEAQ